MQEESRPQVAKHMVCAEAVCGLVRPTVDLEQERALSSHLDWEDPGKNEERLYLEGSGELLKVFQQGEVTQSDVWRRDLQKGLQTSQRSFR